MKNSELPRMQHYLPQWYLRGFTNRGSRSTKGKLRVIDLLERKCFSTSPKDVAKIRDYYVFENEEGQPDYRVETDLFGTIDSEAAAIVKEIEEHRRIPPGGWESLCVFIAFLDLRTPKFRQISHEIAQTYFDIIAHFHLRTPESFAASKKAFESETGQPFDVEYDEMTRFVQEGGLSVEVPRTNDVKMMLDMAQPIAKIICDMTPHLLLAVEKGEFITGDAPIHFRDGDDKRRLSGVWGVGWASPSVEVTLPLTKRCCLILNWDGKPKTIGGSDFSVANCNLFRALATRQYLFGPHGDVPFLQNQTQVLWGEEKFLDCFSEQKRLQPAIQINGGPSIQRTPTRVRR